MSYESFGNDYIQPSNSCDDEKLKLKSTISQLQASTISLNNDKNTMQLEIDKLNSNNILLQSKINELTNANNELKNKKIEKTVQSNSDSCNGNALLYAAISLVVGYLIRK